MIPGILVDLISGLDGLVTVQDKGEKEVAKPQTVGPQENGPSLPKKDCNRPTRRSPFKDLSNSNGLPSKIKPKRVPKIQKPIDTPHLVTPASVKKREHSPENCSDSPTFKKRGVSSIAFPLYDAPLAVAVPQPRRAP